MTEKHEARNAQIVSRIKGAPCAEEGSAGWESEEEDGGGERNAPGWGAVPTRWTALCAGMQGEWFGESARP